MVKQIDRAMLKNDVLVSTVDLTPYFFNEMRYETMIFGLFNDEYQRRCRTLAEARLQHLAAIEIATESNT